MTNVSYLSKRRPVAFKVHVSPGADDTDPRVLCATDLWGASDHALKKALWLAETTHAELMLLHVVDGELPLRLTGRRADHARNALEWRVRRWPHFKPRPAISVRVGNPHEIITRVARDWRADLVVMGASRPRFMDRFVATTAERVAAAAQCAVLVVNRDSPEPYSNAKVIATSCCQAAALEHTAATLQLMEGSHRPRKLHSVTSASDLYIVEADRWPALMSLFRRSAASKLAHDTSADLLIKPHGDAVAAFQGQCPRHQPAIAPG